MGFESFHPAINLLYFTAVIAGTLCFRQPVFLPSPLPAPLPIPPGGAESGG